MSTKMVRGLVAASVSALAIAGTAYADPGKNGAPGPADNPNPPASQPQANAPQGPAGNDAHGKSDTAGSNGKAKGKSEGSKTTSSHGKSGTAGSNGKANGKSKSNGEGIKSRNLTKTTHGKSGSAPSRSNGSHANPTPGTPKNNGNNGAPKGKITICHATKSETNPYVEITISVNGLHGHGPAEDPHHHDGSWKDIIPAPAGGCPSTVQSQTTGSTEQPGGTNTPLTTDTNTNTPATPLNNVAKFIAPEVQTPGTQLVLGERVSGGGNAPANANAPADSSAPQSAVLGEQASGSTAPAAVQGTKAAESAGGSLPFTGFQLALILIVGAIALLGGFALHRATVANRA